MVFNLHILHKIYVLLLFCLIASCVKQKTLNPDVSKINIQVVAERFDQEFAKTTPESLPKLKRDYPFLFSKTYHDTFWIAKRQDTLQVQLFDAVQSTFADFKDTESDINNLFKHLKYYTPEFQPPRVITITNDVDYRNPIIVTDSIVLIALDNYLGSDHKFYANIPKFLRVNFEKSRIALDLAEAYAENEIFQTHRKTFLDEMVYYGKRLYFKQRHLPFKTEASCIGYTPQQLDWVVSNEAYIWRYFVENELLFSSDSKLLSRFINEAPFSKFYLEFIDSKSPGRIGQYIGWQIVRAYMKNNQVSLKEMLIKNTDDIFNNSKFKPRK